MTRLKIITFVGILISLCTQAADRIPVIGDERAVTQHIALSELEKLAPEQIIAQGKLLFNAKFTALDGAGRPASTSAEIPVKKRVDLTPAMFRTSGPDSNACVGCHNQPGSGGAGEFVVNVFASSGVVNVDFDTLEPQFSNERGTPHLHGSGLVELLAREMSADLQEIRRAAVESARSQQQRISVKLITKGVDFGELSVNPDGFIDIAKIQGVDHDLIIRPFSQKGVFTSLRQFSINAMNAHHGIQSNERWGKQWTNRDDFNEDSFTAEISSGDLTAISLYQATLPTPVQKFAEHPLLQEAAAQGEQLYRQAACNQCHMQTLPLASLSFAEPGPYNAAGNLRQTDVAAVYRYEIDSQGLDRDQQGNWLVPIFSDLKRHVIADVHKPHFANERLSQRFIAIDEFMSAKLWGVGSTAPYGHRGDVSTLMEVILHHGGEAQGARKKFEAFSDLQRRKVVEFLKSLQLTQG
ncbi:MAG: hypothetical protein MJK13_04615 [Pseudomonadales bacterium]|nr:hypothetical protein [Pseudomonadales bacterium]